MRADADTAIMAGLRRDVRADNHLHRSLDLSISKPALRENMEGFFPSDPCSNVCIKALGWCGGEGVSI